MIIIIVIIITREVSWNKFSIERLIPKSLELFEVETQRKKYSKPIWIDNMVPGDLSNESIKRIHAPPIYFIRVHDKVGHPPAHPRVSRVWNSPTNFALPGRVSGPERNFIPYYDIINNNTKGEILYYSLR